MAGNPGTFFMVSMFMKIPCAATCVALLVALPSVSRAAADRLEQPITRYEQEYPQIGYSAPARNNRVWRLQQRLDQGELALAWEDRSGYLRSLLAALQINPDTQVLVYSRTSLQFESITPYTPRAIYFNDDTYVGYVPGSPLIELATIEPGKGPMFFVLDNRRAGKQALQREGNVCVACHDTFTLMGGGIPRVLMMSAPVDDPAETRTAPSATETDDRTPLAQRWGGWYVTGSTGSQSHFGNLPLRESASGERLSELRATRTGLASLRNYFDTTPYLMETSDVAALLVLEHQTFIQNAITRVNYKLRAALGRDGEDRASSLTSWIKASQREQTLMRAMLEPLLKALFFHEAAPFEDRIASAGGFAARFSAQAPAAADGRSLRELDLQTRLQRHRLSYLVLSPHFEALPPVALDYLAERIAEVLAGRDATGIAARLPAAEREAIRKILLDASPLLAAHLK